MEELKYMETFKKHLLKIGGKDVLMPESLPIAIQQKGHLYEYKVLVPVGGASRYYISNEDDIHLVWGFVLDEDGVWKVHTWMVHNDRPIIIDNEKHIHYYGFERKVR